MAAGTARAAVQRFLQAGADGDFEVAYGLLDQAGRERYPSLARFTRAQADRAPVTAVRVGRERRAGDGRADVTVTLAPPGGHRPVRRAGPGAHGRGLAGQPPGRPLAGGRRPGVGPGRAARRRPRPRGGLAPGSSGCSTATAPGAAGLQAGAELYGPADLAELPCTERGRWTVAAPEGFDAAVEPEAYVAAFGPEVGAWARLVPVQGPRTRFSVVVGPLGDAWRVLGTDPVTPR